MRYLTFSENGDEFSEYEIALLAPILNRDEMLRWYVSPYLQSFRDQTIAYDLHKEGKRTPVKIIKEYLNEELLPCLDSLLVKHLVVSDAEYFKVLTKTTSTEAAGGYVLPSKLPGWEDHFNVVYAPNYQAIFYDPDRTKAKIHQGITALTDFIGDVYEKPGEGLIRFAAYPKTADEIQVWLQRIYDMDCDLAADIETYSLKHWNAGIGTITLCWSKHEGIAFPVDMSDDPQRVRKMLRIFFENFQHKMLWHNITFDVYVLVYQLFMDHLLDTEGLLHGLDVLLRNWDDTKLITYLATNSCAGNKLGLKTQAQEYAGNYAVEDIADISKVPLDDLLEYNLVDGLSTWYVYEKHHPTMVQDQQEQVYNLLFKLAVVDIIQMQLTGLPLDMKEVKKCASDLEADAQDAIDRMVKTSLIQGFTYQLNETWAIKKNQKLKKKKVTPADGKEVFNPNSAPQLQRLLYSDECLGFPIIDTTDSNLPATGADTLKKLKNHTTDQEILDFLDALIDYKAVAIILSTFIPAFLNAPMGPDGWHYLFGNFNLGGTLSGRLSSNNPNLQNIPSSGTRYAKIIKRCFKAPPGWLFVGLDFSSLEDRISALTTKDPNKLKVYTDGYDGHSLRAFAYFGDQMSGIIDGNVASINSIQDIYKPLRQESKAPTFALTYQGTFHTLMNNCGFTESKARMVENRFRDLYKVSIQWVEDKLDQASKDGYVTCAFGLRLRTPLLKQVVRGNSRTPYEAQAEGRTAGNALGQSWCLLNSRAASAFMGKVRTSRYRLDIRPCAHIHDAQYYLIRDDLKTLLWMNDTLVPEVRWQDHPDIWHPDVKLGGELSIFWPNWACEMVVPNEANENDVVPLLKKHFDEYAEAA